MEETPVVDQVDQTPVDTADGSGEPKAGPTPEQQPGDPYAGKSVADVIRMHQELERKLGDQGRELGELRGQINRRPEPTYAPEPPRKEPVKFNYDNPEDSVRNVVRQELDAEAEERGRVESSRQDYEARLNYEAGWREASAKNPRLYQGIENEVKSALYNTYRGGLVHPSQLRDGRTWERVAQNIRLEREEYDYIVPVKKEPMSKPSTEKPSPTRVQDEKLEDTIELSEADRSEAAKWNLSDDEARKIIADEIRARRGGAR